MHAFISSRLDYLNAFPINLPKKYQKPASAVSELCHPNTSEDKERSYCICFTVIELITCQLLFLRFLYLFLKHFMILQHYMSEMFNIE